MKATCTLPPGYADTETSVKAGAASASLDAGLCSKTPGIGMTRVSHMASVLRPGRYLVPRSRLDEARATQTSGRVFVRTVTRGLGWSVARREGRHGFAMLIRLVPASKGRGPGERDVMHRSNNGHGITIYIVL